MFSWSPFVKDNAQETITRLLESKAEQLPSKKSKCNAPRDTTLRRLAELSQDFDVDPVKYNPFMHWDWVF